MESDRSKGIFWLGVLILLIFVATMAAALCGAYSILIGGLTVSDPAIVAVVFTMIGGIITSVTGMALLVGNYYYGSSHSSAVKSELMAGKQPPP